MKTYYTKYFKNGTYDDIGDWLNEFEQKRDGRLQCEYYIDIDNILVTSDGILVVVIVFEYTKNA